MRVKLNSLQKINLLLIVLLLVVLVAVSNIDHFVSTQDMQQRYVDRWQTKLDNANDLIKHKKFDEGEVELEKIISDIPCSQPHCRLAVIKMMTLFRLGQFYIDQKDWGKASKTYAETSEFIPQNYLAYLLWGKAEMNDGNLKKALERTETSLQYFPEFVPGIEQKITILLERGKTKELNAYWQFLQNETWYFEEDMIAKINPSLRHQVEKELNPESL